eukprot:m.182865 g.182865  ORF g.182865 m.182865 type:complete len:715 (+) comp18473_c0_seq2:123-2267(+)
MWFPVSAALTVLSLLQGARVDASDAPPSVIMAVVDDLGWNDVGWHDEFHQIKTPKLDQLVREESILLTNYYVYRFCSPSRSTFMTGRYPWHIGQQTQMNLNPTPGIACGINLKYDFLPKVLKQKGYATWALGKWHLGFLTTQFTPTYRGFDHYLGYYSGAEEHFTHEKAGIGITKYDLSNNTGTSIAPCLNAVGNASATYSSYLYGNETLRLLDAHDASVPVFIYLAWNNVHSPCEAPDNYLVPNMEINNTARRNLAGMMAALDDQLTAVIDGFKTKGMWDNTFFIFTTDNGGNLGGSGINYPLRGGKYTFWQGGCRGNSFVAGGLIPQHMRGTQWGGAAHAADWYTTIAALAGASVEASGPLPVDGVELFEAITSNATSPRTEIVLQIVTNSTNNHFDSAMTQADCDANPGDAALCDAPNEPPTRYVVDPLPPRPFPALTTCDAQDATQQWDVNASYAGSICSTTTGLCFNVQQSHSNLILFAASSPEPNTVFGFSIGPDHKLTCALRSSCVLAQQKGEQLQLAQDASDCAKLSAEADSWTYASATKQIQHTASGETLCVTAVPAPPAPPSPVGLQTGVLIQGQYKLIMGYPGWGNPEWDQWPLPPSMAASAPQQDSHPHTAAGEKYCADTPCLFDIFADPTEHNDIHDKYPDVVAKMSKRVLELAQGEVTLKDSGLCPTPIGSRSDPRSKAAAILSGFWEPWLPPINLTTSH